MKWSLQELLWAWRMVLIWRWKNPFKNLYLVFYHFFYWLRHGVSNVSTWELDAFLINVLIDRLKRFEKGNRYKAMENENDSKWYPEAKGFQNDIREIISGFELYKNQDYKNYEEDQAKISRAFDLFRDNFGGFWD